MSHKLYLYILQTVHLNNIILYKYWVTILVDKSIITENKCLFTWHLVGHCYKADEGCVTK